MSIINTYNIFLNSKQRDSGSSNEFIVNLLKPITLTNPNNWFTVRIGSAEIPYIFQLINPSNSTIQVSVTRGATTQTGNFSIESGNYNILVLLDAIKSKLTTTIQALIGYTPTFSFTYSRTTGKCTLAMLANGDTVGCSITIFNNSPVVMTCLGFFSAFTFAFTNSSTTQAISTQNVNVAQNNAIFIRSESLVQTSNFESIVEKSNISDILAKIQVTSLPQSYLIWVNPADLEVKINNRLIDSISLYLSSSLSYALDLQNLDWQCRMTFKEYSNFSAEDQYSHSINNTVPSITNFEDDSEARGRDELQQQRDILIEQLKKSKQKLYS